MTDQQNWHAGTPAPGPRQVADFDKARGRLSWEAKTFVELTGTVGDEASERRTALTQPVGGVYRADVAEAVAEIGERHGWTLTRDNVRAVTAELEAATKEASSRRPVDDQRITVAERDQRDTAMRERTAEQNERQAAAAASWQVIRDKAPAGVAAVILAELEEDTSDMMSDYFANRTVRTVAIGWRYGSRENFAQLRAAAASFAETAELDSAGAEHRDNYSMGKGNYLGTGNSGSGWCVRSRSLSYPPSSVVEDALPAAPAAGEITAAAEGVTISPGRRPGIVEVRFSAKPAEEIRAALKAARFRWARSNGCWYGPADRLPECCQAGPHGGPNATQRVEATGLVGHAPDIDIVNGY